MSVTFKLPDDSIKYMTCCFPVVLSYKKSVIFDSIPLCVAV